MIVFSFLFVFIYKRTEAKKRTNFKSYLFVCLFHNAHAIDTDIVLCFIVVSDGICHQTTGKKEEKVVTNQLLLYHDNYSIDLFVDILRKIKGNDLFVDDTVGIYNVHILCLTLKPIFNVLIVELTNNAQCTEQQ